MQYVDVGIPGTGSAGARRDAGPREEAVALHAKFFAGLANPVRLRMVELLLERERTVGELAQLLQVSQGHVSNQLACLRWCGYVHSRSQGRHTVYEVRDVRVRALIELARAIVADRAEYIASCTRL